MSSTDLTKTEALARADRANSALARLRARGKRTAGQVQTLAGMALGGVAAGTIMTHAPFVPGSSTMLTVDVVAGGLTLLGLSGFIDDEQMNDFILAVAGGFVAVRASDAARQFALRPRNQPQAPPR